MTHPIVGSSGCSVGPSPARGHGPSIHHCAFMALCFMGPQGRAGAGAKEGLPRDSPPRILPTSLSLNEIMGQI